MNLITSFLGSFSKYISLDLGTSKVLINVKDRGIVVNEPSTISVDKNISKVIAFGEKAKLMLGRNPQHIMVHSPIVHGKIKNFDETFFLLKHFFDKIQRISGIYPQVCVSIPSNITDIEEKAIREVILKSGASKVFTIEVPLAAALGANIPIDDPKGFLIVDLGAGTTNIGLLSLDGIANCKTLPIAGNTFDQAIINILKKEYSLLVGRKTAEEIKIEIGTLLPSNKNLNFEIRGRDLSSGLPKSVILQTNIITKAILPYIDEIIASVKELLDKTSPELSADIIDSGIILTGGGALIKGIDKYFSEKLKINTIIASEPELCVVKGSLRAMELMDKNPSLKKLLSKTTFDLNKK